MSDCDVGLRQGQHDAVESRIEVGVWVPCDWQLPGLRGSIGPLVTLRLPSLVAGPLD